VLRWAVTPIQRFHNGGIMESLVGFDAPGNWYRGNLHTHTVVSDGLRTPAETVSYYRGHGYDFMAITDHLVFAETEGLCSDDFLVIPGIEVHGDDPIMRFYHIVGLGGDLAPGTNLESLNSFQGDVDRLCVHSALVHFAHPYWLGQSAHNLLQVQGPASLEVYNTVCDVGYRKGYSNQTWDDMLAAGRRIWGMAVDDAHWVEWRNDTGQGWVMVNAPELTQSAILHALRNGRFYASTGPEIYNVQVEDDEVVIRCSPAASIHAIGNRWFCNVARSVSGLGITEARLPLWEGQTYVRAEVVDRFGKYAWSNPIFFDEPIRKDKS
jgi:hypothetical protein